MCGIFGIITTLKNQNLYQIIINGLIQLQNRGYDSSGICILNNGEFKINKYASSINKLLSTPINNNNISLGIELLSNTTGTKFQGYTGSAWVDLN